MIERDRLDKFRLALAKPIPSELDGISFEVLERARVCHQRIMNRAIPSEEGAIYEIAKAIDAALKEGS